MSDLPPMYAATSLPCPLNLPQYSHSPREDERVLSSEPSSPVFDLPHTDRRVFQSSYLEIDFGYFPLTLKHPAYGYNGLVEGILKFTRGCSYVTEVTVKLEGILTTTASEYGTLAVPSITKVPLMSHTSTVVANSSSTSGGYRCICPGAEYAFSIPFPSYISGRNSPLPPSYTAIHPGICTEVGYYIQVEIVRKGVFRRRGVCKIPVLYLPKTRPPVQPLTELTQLSLEAQSDSFKGVHLAKIWPRCSSSRLLPDHLPSVQLLLPYPRCFASGQPIPLGLIISCPASPALAQLYASNISVTLMKRTKLIASATNRFNIRDIVLSTAQPVRQSDSSNGAERHLWYALGAGRSGQETYWQVEGSIEVSYHVRVVLQPLQKQYLPTFRKEELIKLSTDAYDTLEIESLGGGLSEPAIGLTTLEC